jgi:HEAT repeat protein
MWTTLPLLCWTLAALALGTEDSKSKNKPELPSDIAPLVKQLKSKDPLERRQAAAGLGERGESAKAAAPALIAALKDKDEFVRRMAVRSLGQINADPDLAIPALKGLLKDEDKGVIESVGEAFAKMGKPAVPALSEMLKMGDPLVKKTSALALGKIGPDAKDAVPALIAAFKAETPRPRMQSGSLRMVYVETFAQIGPNAKAAIKTLEDALEENRDREFARAAREAIRKMGGTPSMPKKKT